MRRTGRFFSQLSGSPRKGRVKKKFSRTKKDCKDCKDQRARSQLSLFLSLSSLQSVQRLMSLLRLLSPEMRFQTKIGRQTAEEAADLIRVQAGRDQTAVKLQQAAVPGPVELPLGAAQDRRDVRHASAVEEAQLEQEALLGGELPEQWDEELAETARGALPFPVHDPALDLAVDRDLEELLLARPPPLAAAGEARREPRHLVLREDDPMVGPQALGGFGAGEPVPEDEPFQEHARRPTPAGGRGGAPVPDAARRATPGGGPRGAPFAPEMDPVGPQQVRQHGRQEGREGAAAL